MEQDRELSIPSGSKANICIIDTTSFITNVPLSAFMEPPMPGFNTVRCPVYSFLIESASGRKVIFDLGVRRDFKNLTPAVLEMVRDSNITVEKDVAEILQENNIDLKDIEAIILSHPHFDHVGDVSTFPPTADLIVGPGFQKAFLPGYPSNPESSLHESDHRGRNVVELDFSIGNSPNIEGFDSIDYFGDGSFYLLNAPGHTIGHICGLVRTTVSPDTFILIAADAFHHGGLVRPSKYQSIPSLIHPHPFNHSAPTACPGEIFESLRKSQGRGPEQSFFDVSHGGFAQNVDEANKTLAKMQKIDGAENVFLVIAHDETLRNAIDFFPLSAHEWKSKGWKENTRWLFLKDFESAVKHGR